MLKVYWGRNAQDHSEGDALLLRVICGQNVLKILGIHATSRCATGLWPGLLGTDSFVAKVIQEQAISPNGLACEGK